MANRFVIYFLLLFALGAHADAKSGAANGVTKIESKFNIRLGIFAIQDNKIFSYREDERFAYCSTFKWILCASILKKVETGNLSLAQKIKYQKKDVLAYSPVTSKNLSTGEMSISDLCAATIQVSDNTAANLLSPLVGKTSGLQTFVRDLGDSATRFDRSEPELNSNVSGDLRDTTTPKAMSYLLKNVLTGDKLKKDSQSQLISWMKGTSTGKDRVRAGVPKEWVVGNKTGTGDNGAVNDVGVIFPNEGLPIYISIFTSGNGSDLKSHEKAISGVTALALKALKVQ
jgi:beta-lactamase class A